MYGGSRDSLESWFLPFLFAILSCCLLLCTHQPLRARLPCFPPCHRDIDCAWLYVGSGDPNSGSSTVWQALHPLGHIPSTGPHMSNAFFSLPIRFPTSDWYVYNANFWFVKFISYLATLWCGGWRFWCFPLYFWPWSSYSHAILVLVKCRTL